MSDEIRERIRERLEELGQAPRAASIAAGMSPDAIRSIFRNKDSSPTVETLTKLSGPLKTTPEWLAFGVGDELAQAQEETAARKPAFLQVIGEVAAGRWLEVDEHVDEPAFEPVPIQPDPRWRAEDQYGLIVRGASLNRIALDGDVLACVNAVAARYRPVEDDLVVVEMRRNAGFLRQRTAKRFVPQETHVELWPDSDDPRWQSPIIVPKGSSSLEYMVEDEEGRIDVAITALVTWVHRPIQRRTRR